MLNKQKISQFLGWFVVIVLLTASFLLMFFSSHEESATMDELAHIPSGYSYVRFLDYRLNPEHPPLLKAIAGFPLLFLNLNFPLENKSWTDDVNGQWDAGTEFIYKSGNDADKIVQWSRIGPMLLTLLFIILVYIWSKEIMGKAWALIPTAFTALSPTILAHGHLVTTDLAASFGAMFSIYFLVRGLMSPSAKNLSLAGIAFGIAQCLKFSAILLYPLFIFLIAIYALWKNGSEWRAGGFFQKIWSFLKTFYRGVIQALIIFGIAFVVIYAVYFLFTLKYPIERQISDTSAILNDGKPISQAIIKMAGNPFTRPLGQYFLGVDMVSTRASGGNTGYFMGEITNLGWKTYFPILYFTKETIPSLILTIIGLLTILIAFIKKLSWNPFKVIKRLIKSMMDYVGVSFAEFAMASFIVLYWAYSLRSPLNIGIRHILPTIPMVYILSSIALKKFFSQNITFSESILKNFAILVKRITTKTAKVVFISGLLIWQGIECFASYPYFISYYNQFAGGTENGYKIATDSNYDWGQDLLRLKEFVEKNKIEKIAVDYFGGGNPEYYLGEKYVEWHSDSGNPKYQDIEWLAVSSNFMMQAKAKPVRGFYQNSDQYDFIENADKPYTRAGKSIFIYKLNDQLPISNDQ